MLHTVEWSSVLLAQPDTGNKYFYLLSRTALPIRQLLYQLFFLFVWAVCYCECHCECPCPALLCASSAQARGNLLSGQAEAQLGPHHPPRADSRIAAATIWWESSIAAAPSLQFAFVLLSEKVKLTCPSEHSFLECDCHIH